MDLGMSFVRGKWKAVILCHMNDGPVRFLELQRRTKGISHKVLNEKLKELERDGIIIKHVFDEVPPHVEFELSEMGQELFTALKMIEHWSTKHFQAVDLDE
jgi:DNA-binding HxlR family transcriptional regulator